MMAAPNEAECKIDEEEEEEREEAEEGEKVACGNCVGVNAGFGVITAGGWCIKDGCRLNFSAICVVFNDALTVSFTSCIVVVRL
jgi:hypothetical protein